jgi:hypothetical protein
LHKIGNGVRVVNFAILKKLTVRSRMFSRHNIHKYTSSSPDGKAYNQIYRIFDRQKMAFKYSDVLSFRATDCDTDHCLVVTEVKEKLAVSKQTMQQISYGEVQSQKVE